MSNAQEEFQAAAAEIADEVGVRCRISGIRFRGVVRNITSEIRLSEPGYSDVNVVSITAALSAFDEYEGNAGRETVEVLEGPNQGLYAVTATNKSLATIRMTASRRE